MSRRDDIAKYFIVYRKVMNRTTQISEEIY